MKEKENEIQPTPLDKYKDPSLDVLFDRDSLWEDAKELYRIGGEFGKEIAKALLSAAFQDENYQGQKGIMLYKNRMAMLEKKQETEEHLANKWLDISINPLYNAWLDTLENEEQKIVESTDGLAIPSFTKRNYGWPEGVDAYVPWEIVSMIHENLKGNPPIQSVFKKANGEEISARDDIEPDDIIEAIQSTQILFQKLPQVIQEKIQKTVELRNSSREQKFGSEKQIQTLQDAHKTATKTLAIIVHSFLDKDKNISIKSPDTTKENTGFQKKSNHQEGSPKVEVTTPKVEENKIDKAKLDMELARDAVSLYFPHAVKSFAGIELQSVVTKWFEELGGEERKAIKLDTKMHLDTSLPDRENFTRYFSEGYPIEKTLLEYYGWPENQKTQIPWAIIILLEKELTKAKSQSLFRLINRGGISCRELLKALYKTPTVFNGLDEELRNEIRPIASTSMNDSPKKAVTLVAKIIKEFTGEQVMQQADFNESIEIKNSPKYKQIKEAWALEEEIAILEEKSTTLQDKIEKERKEIVTKEDNLTVIEKTLRKIRPLEKIENHHKTINQHQNMQKLYSQRIKEIKPKLDTISIESSSYGPEMIDTLADLLIQNKSIIHNLSGHHKGYYIQGSFSGEKDKNAMIRRKKQTIEDKHNNHFRYIEHSTIDSMKKKEIIPTIDQTDPNYTIIGLVYKVHDIRSRVGSMQIQIYIPKSSKKIISFVKNNLDVLLTIYEKRLKAHDPKELLYEKYKSNTIKKKSQEFKYAELHVEAYHNAKFTFTTRDLLPLKGSGNKYSS